ncbi:hypothetical protein LOAG_01884 [Loa loa]|uniref:Uncharacterized protein n=1 Tax=Loa loa TaxID=7209 RepID=A0A1S0U7W3_LOALO|nr:hypothetical protein LOAG_01884 [Loa loa]EFO26596.1 hypothetical protein LOAG_01884 [Loa loa]
MYFSISFWQCLLSIITTASCLWSQVILLLKLIQFLNHPTASSFMCDMERKNGFLFNEKNDTWAVTVDEIYGGVTGRVREKWCKSYFIYVAALFQMFMFR